MGGSSNHQLGDGSSWNPGVDSSGCTATAYSTGIYASTDRARGHPVDGGITSGQQPENLNKIDAKIQLEGDLQMIDFNDFDHGWQTKFA